MTPAIRTALFIMASLYCVAIPAQSTATSQESTPETSAQVVTSTESDELERLDHNIALQPDRVDLRFDRARVLESLDRTEEAMLEYRWLLDHYPERPEAYNNMARLLAHTGETQQAIALLEQGLATHPVYQLMFNNMRKLFDSMAQQAYQAALKEPESHDEALLSDKVVHVELKGVESIDAPQVADVAPLGRSESSASLLQSSVNMPLESSTDTARQVASREE
jgi:tetratricopeptide (TPR) repeat protein